MTTKTNNKIPALQPQTTALYSLSAKLLAIGELIKFRGGESSLEEERINYGLGDILTDLASERRSMINK